MEGPPSIEQMMRSRKMENEEDSGVMRLSTVKSESFSGLRASENEGKVKRRFYDSDSDDNTEDIKPAKIESNKNSIGTLYDDADEFTSFEALMKVDRVRSNRFFRTPFDVKGGKQNFYAIPWPAMRERARSLLTFKKNLYFKLDGVFFVWTPLITHEKTNVTISITDKRGSSGKPTIVNSVNFTTNNVTMSGMSVGNCFHIDDLKLIELSVTLEKSISSRTVKHTSLEVLFYITITNRPTLETHSVISPVIVPPAIKNLLKDFKSTTSFLRNSNARIIKKVKDKEEEEEFERDLTGAKKESGQSSEEALVEKLVRMQTKNPSTRFGASEVKFTNK
jgi:hypothetical protein